MQISARHQLSETITVTDVDGVTAKVILNNGDAKEVTGVTIRG